MNMETVKSAVIHATDDDFETQVIDSDVPVLLDFWAEWCGPCKALNPVIEDLANDFDGQAKIVKVNVDECPQTAKRFGVRGIPHMLVIVGGESVANVGKVRTRESLKTIMNGYVDGKDSNEVLEENLSDLTLRQEFLLSGDIDRVRSFLTVKRHYVNEKLSYDQTPIGAALMANKMDRVKLFMEFEPEMTPSDLAGAGLVDELIEQLKTNPDIVNEPCETRNPLLWTAIRSGQIASIDVLLDAGADINWGKSDDDRPLLLMASFGGQIDVMRHLVERGMKLQDPIGGGETILHFITDVGDEAMIAYLLEQGLDPEAKDERGITPIDVAKKRMDKEENGQAVLKLLNVHKKNSK